MTESFQRRLVEAVRLDAERRARGSTGSLWRIFAWWSHHEGNEMRFSKPAVMSAVSESAERFSAEDRAAFDAAGSLPGWFWPWVEERARWWDGQLDLREGAPHLSRRRLH